MVPSRCGLDDIEELRWPVETDDRCRPRPGLPRAGTNEQRLVQPERSDAADAVVVLDERGAVGTDRVHDRVPIAAQLAGDLRDAASVATDLRGDPPAGPVGDLRASSGDRRRLLGPGARRTVAVWAEPAAFVPHQHRRAAERWQVDQRHLGPVLHPRSDPAATAADHGRGGLDRDPQRTALFIDHAENDDVGQTDEQRAHARRVNFHRGSERSTGVRTVDSPSPCTAPGGPLHRYTPLNSEEPDFDV